MEKCPRCGLNVSELHHLEPDFIAQVQAIGETLPESICVSCISDLRKTLSQSRGGVLLAQERAHEQYRLELWKNRVALIKKARDYMNRKNYTAAAVTYEKYLKVLEIVFKTKKGTLLSPGLFKDAARTSEITVVATVYWDLFRIYDTNPKYSERQLSAGKQLASFIQYSPMYPDFIKKGEAFIKSSNNPANVKAFIKEATQQRPRCFIATSTYRSAFHPDVIYLRLFRDDFLLKYKLGHYFVKFYYLTSPKIAEKIESSKLLTKASQWALAIVIKCIRFIY